MSTTYDRLRAILIKEYGVDADKLTPDASLEELGIDSLGIAELLFNVEDEFGITLPPDAVRLTTMGDVAGFIDALIPNQKVQGDSLEPPAPPVP